MRKGSQVRYRGLVPRTLIDGCRLSQPHLPHLPKHSALSHGGHFAIDPGLGVSRDLVEEALLGHHFSRRGAERASLSGRYRGAIETADRHPRHIVSSPEKLNALPDGTFAAIPNPAFSRPWCPWLLSARYLRRPIRVLICVSHQCHPLPWAKSILLTLWFITSQITGFHSKS